MIHMPSAIIYEQLLSNLSLVRLVSARGSSEDEVTLIIKCNSLLIKYILQGAGLSIRLIVLENNELCYACQIDDDPNHPASFWSGALDQSEINLLKRFAKEKKAVVFIFNEACVNVASSFVSVSSLGDSVFGLLESAKPITTSEHEISKSVNIQVDLNAGNSGNEISIKPNDEWKLNHSTYITNGFGRSDINFNGTDEGDQQQELVRWLVDSLRPTGAFLSPQIHEPSGKKEYTDVMLSYEYGVFLIESKTISLFTREHIPVREKLTRTIIKHIDDAVSRQLRIACRQLKDNISIYQKDTETEIAVQRNMPPHAICLIPDLSLIREKSEYGRSMLTRFLIKNKAYLHILDTSQLYRMVQAAFIISKSSKSVTPMMAFDAHLIQRFNFASTIDEPDIDMLIDLKSSTPHVAFAY